VGVPSWRLGVKDIEEPSDIVKVNVCKDSGLLPNLFCSLDIRGNRVYEELFIKGTEPTTNCQIHPTTISNILNSGLSTSETNNITGDVKVPPITNDTLNPPPVNTPTPSNNNNTINNNSIDNTTKNTIKNKNNNSNHNSLGPGDINSGSSEQTSTVN
jgi:penicillin-binding protein 1A